jgi:hypothetical protein
MLVDLFTYDPELDSIILESFPGKIVPKDQYHIDDSETGTKLFCFYDLDQRELAGFLSSYKAKHGYEIRGKKGEIIEANIVNRLESILIKNN